MTKNELKALSEKYGMEIMRDPITNQAWGLSLETALDIPEVDALCDSDTYHTVSATKAYGAYEAVSGTHYYTVYCPKSWFDLWGWV